MLKLPLLIRHYDVTPFRYDSVATYAAIIIFT